MSEYQFEHDVEPGLYVQEDCDSNTIYKSLLSENYPEFENDSFVTAASPVDTTDYIKMLPNEFNILRNADIAKDGIRNNSVIKHVEIFLSVFQRVLLNNRNMIDDSVYLPPLKFKWIDGESILIEWVFKDFRIGFTIESNINESGWYLVSNENLGEFSVSDNLYISDLESLLVNLLRFVLGHA